MFDFGSQASALDPAASWKNTGASLQARNENAGILQTESFSGLQGRSSLASAIADSEPNNTILQATDLGTINNSSISLTGSVALNVDNVDYYKFRVDSPMRLNTVMSGLSANASLNLFGDFNNNGRWDAHEFVSYSAQPGTANETINADRLLPGTYYLMVNPVSGSTNYNLRVSTTPVTSASITLDIDEIRALETFDFGAFGWQNADFMGTVRIDNGEYTFGTFQNQQVVQGLQFSRVVNLNERFIDFLIEVRDEDTRRNDTADISPNSSTHWLEFKYDTLSGRLLGVDTLNPSTTYAENAAVHLEGKGEEDLAYAGQYNNHKTGITFRVNYNTFG